MKKRSKRTGRSHHRKGTEFERAIRRALAAVFGDHRVQRGVRRVRGRATPDVVAPGFLVECKAGRRTSLRVALRQAVRQAEGLRGLPVAVCKNDRDHATVAMRFEDFVSLVRDWHELKIR